MANNRKVVQIFLASPGDLQDERQAAKAVVDAFNKRWADWLGIQVELVGWEDTFKRWGRPQEQINLDLDRCEAFIGMLWRKWGTPPSTDGHYTSGFEEEFERAHASRKTSSRPEMTLFLKTIDAEFLKDQGPDLRKVLSFRERVMAEKLILFEEFETLREFEEKLSTWITQYVQSLKQQEAISASEELQVRVSNDPATKGESPPSQTPLTTKGAKFIREFVDKIENHSDTHPIQSTEVARMRLLANMIGVSGNDENSLGVHDANLLFRYRLSLDLSQREIEDLIDSGLDNISQEVVPLWYWYAAADAHNTGRLSLITLIGSQSERVGALTAMRLICEPVKPLPPFGRGERGLERAEFVSAWLSPTSSEQVKVAALEYLSACGDADDIPVLEVEYEKRNYQTVGAAVDAIIRINFRQSREKAVRALIDLQPERIDEGLVDAIFAKPESLPTPLLSEATAHRNAKVREVVVAILAARKALPADIAERLLDDSSAGVRFEAVWSLAREGRDFSDERAKAILVKPAARAGLGGLFGYPTLAPDKEGEAQWERFKKVKLRDENTATLEKLRTEATILDNDARFALDFKLFRQRAAVLRAAVDDEFRSDFTSGYQELEKRLTNTETLAKIKSIEDHVRKEMMRRGLDVLCEKGEPDDLARIRRAMTDGLVEFSPVDVEYLRKNGEWQDIALLVGLLDRTDSRASLLLSGLYDEEKISTHRPGHPRDCQRPVFRVARLNHSRPVAFARHRIRKRATDHRPFRQRTPRRVWCGF